MSIFKRKIKDPVQGTLHVVSTSQPPSGGLSVWMVMDVVVSVPGHESYPDRRRFFVDLDKFPRPGMVLPIEASASNPKRFTIQWDQVAPTSSVAASQAQQLADSLNAQTNDDGSDFFTQAAPTSTPTGPTDPGGGATVITGDAAAEIIKNVLGTAGSGAAGTPGVTVQRSVTINGRPAQPGELAPFETLAGMDLDGDGVIGPNPGPPA